MRPVLNLSLEPASSCYQVFLRDRLEIGETIPGTNIYCKRRTRLASPTRCEFSPAWSSRMAHARRRPKTTTDLDAPMCMFLSSPALKLHGPCR